MKLVCKDFTDKGPARAANILPVKATHTTGCLKELKTVPNLHHVAGKDMFRRTIGGGSCI